jgi:hypothetical protein
VFSRAIYAPFRQSKRRWPLATRDCLRYSVESELILSRLSREQFASDFEIIVADKDLSPTPEAAGPVNRNIHRALATPDSVDA